MVLEDRRPRQKWTGGGRCSSRDSILRNTFRFRKQALGWPHRRSVLPRPQIGEPGFWSLPTPNFALSGSRPSSALEKAQQARTGPRPPGVREHPEPTSPVRPVFPNLAAPAPDDHPGVRTADLHPATTWARPSSAPKPSKPSADQEDLGSQRTRASIALRCGSHTPQHVQSRSVTLSARSDVPKQWVCVTAPGSYCGHPTG